MRVLVLDKTAGLESSHERHQKMASVPGIDLHVLGPDHWIESGRDTYWNPPEDCNYTAYKGKVFGKDYYARVGYYSGFSTALHQSQPDIIQLFEEPWSISALQTILEASLFAPQAKILFYTWENIYRPWRYPSRASFLYAMIDKILHSRSSGAICATEQAQTVLKQKGYKMPTTVIPYGIPKYFFHEYPRTWSDDDPFTIGYVGRMIHMKGIDLLMEAVAKFPDCKLLLVGNGPDDERYLERAKILGILDRVEWITTLAEERIPHALSRMDLFVMPSRRMDGWMEQLGRAAIEAMAMGVPVIVSNSGALPEVVGSAATVFQENSVQSLIDKIELLKRNPALYQSTSFAGKMRGRCYTWDRFAEQIAQFYNSLI